MNKSDLFKLLARGELSNLSFAEDGVIKANKVATLTQHANEALLRLTTRLPLIEKDLLIELRDGMTNYHLVKQYAWSQAPEGTSNTSWCAPYIMDKVDPFQEDVVKILRVYNSYGIELPLNDQNEAMSLFTPQAKVLQVPFYSNGDVLNVVYHAHHPVLEEDCWEQCIQVPDNLMGALRAYIAHLVYAHMNTAESVAISSNHLSSYDRICMEFLESASSNVSKQDTNTTFEKRGWI